MAMISNFCAYSFPIGKRFAASLNVVRFSICLCKSSYGTFSDSVKTTTLSSNQSFGEVHLSFDDLKTRFNRDRDNTGHVSIDVLNEAGTNEEHNCQLLKGCSTAYEVVEAVNKIGDLSKSELAELHTKVVELVSSDMKQNAILLFTLNEFELDLGPFMDKLMTYEFVDPHYILRALSESDVTNFKTDLVETIDCLNTSFFSETNPIFMSKFQTDGSETQQDVESVMELYNYICSYCKFLTKKVVSVNHLGFIESFINAKRFYHRLEVESKDSYAGVEQTGSKPVKDELDILGIFTTQQLVDLCYHLALVKSDSCKTVLHKLDAMDFYEKVRVSELIRLFTKAVVFDERNRIVKLERILMNLYKAEEYRLDLSDCVNMLVAIGRSRRCDVALVDKLVEDLKSYTNELELGQITTILINLSKVNYRNAGFVRHLSNMVLTFVDEDSILDPHTISNLLKALGRFGQSNERLVVTLVEVLLKEEVLAEVELHDLVSIFVSLSKILTSPSLRNVAVSAIKRRLGFITRPILNNGANTEMAVSLINASGRIMYDNTRFLNALIESINLSEIENLSTLFRLKINADKLSLYYPELEVRIKSLQARLEPVSPEEPRSGSNSDEEAKAEGKVSDHEDKGNWFERNVHVGRSFPYRNLRIQSVRKRKWTY